MIKDLIIYIVLIVLLIVGCMGLFGRFKNFKYETHIASGIIVVNLILFLWMMAN